MGNGCLLRATPDQDSIGQLATHGCIHLRADDIDRLLENVSVGTAVYWY